MRDFSTISRNHSRIAHRLSPRRRGGCLKSLDRGSITTRAWPMTEHINPLFRMSGRLLLPTPSSMKHIVQLIISSGNTFHGTAVEDSHQQAHSFDAVWLHFNSSRLSFQYFESSSLLAMGCELFSMELVMKCNSQCP